MKDKTKDADGVLWESNEMTYVKGLKFCFTSEQFETPKPYLRSTSIQCYLCLLLNSHFLTEAGIHVFILGCISAGLPKTEANWQHVISDLKRIEDLIQ
ncbi:Interleukin-15, partial [Eschrichtius robustus]|nr:Interleukin-15 [Eschrichtius robustus]